MKLDEFNQELAALLRKHELKNFMIIVTNSGTDTVAGVSLSAETPADVSSMFHALTASLFPLLAAKNGLPPVAAAEALKGLIAEALQDRQEYTTQVRDRADQLIDSALRPGGR